jgi:hypothetical protein
MVAHQRQCRFISVNVFALRLVQSNRKLLIQSNFRFYNYVENNGSKSFKSLGLEPEVKTIEFGVRGIAESLGATRGFSMQTF